MYIVAYYTWLYLFLLLLFNFFSTVASKILNYAYIFGFRTNLLSNLSKELSILKVGTWSGYLPGSDPQYCRAMLLRSNHIYRDSYQSV